MQHIGKSPTVRDVPGGRKTFYLPRYLKYDQSSSIQSFCIKGRDQERGAHSPRLVGMFVPRLGFPPSDHSWADLDKRSRVMQSLVHGGLSVPAPFSTSTHLLTRSPREICVGLSSLFIG